MKLEHNKDAFHLLVADKDTIPQFLPEHLEARSDVPVVLFSALLAPLHKKHEGLKADNDWLAMLSVLSAQDQPQLTLEVSSAADLHHTTRTLFAEKVRCKVAIAKGLRRILLTCHISLFEHPPEKLEHLVLPNRLLVSDPSTFLQPCLLSVTSSVPTEEKATFQQRIDQDRSKRMEETWVAQGRTKHSSLQDFFLEWLANLRKQDSLLQKKLRENLTKAAQMSAFKAPHQSATTLLLKACETRENVQVAQMVDAHKADFNKSHPDSSCDEWKTVLSKSLREDSSTKKMTAKTTKAGPLNTFLAIPTQIIIVNDAHDGSQLLENDDRLFQVVRRNGRRSNQQKHEKVSASVFPLCGSGEMSPNIFLLSFF
jgi:hypothetical protein